MLAILVGLFQMVLGLLRLGVLVDFLSHPVVVGFTNAGAIIIATSQLGKLFGVSVPKAEHQYETVWNIIVAATQNTHWATLGIAIVAFAIMVVMRRFTPKLPQRPLRCCRHHRCSLVDEPRSGRCQGGRYHSEPASADEPAGR